MKYILFVRIILGFEDFLIDDKMVFIKGEYVISISQGNKIVKKKVLSFIIYIENRILNINYDYLKYLFIFFIYILYEIKFKKYDFQYK